MDHCLICNKEISEKLWYWNYVQEAHPECMLLIEKSQREIIQAIDFLFKENNFFKRDIHAYIIKSASDGCGKSNLKKFQKKVSEIKFKQFFEGVAFNCLQTAYEYYFSRL